MFHASGPRGRKDSRRRFYRRERSPERALWPGRWECSSTQEISSGVVAGGALLLLCIVSEASTIASKFSGRVFAQTRSVCARCAPKRCWSGGLADNFAAAALDPPVVLG